MCKTFSVNGRHKPHKGVNLIPTHRTVLLWIGCTADLDPIDLSDV